jgi:hypothetical protein
MDKNITDIISHIKTELESKLSYDNSGRILCDKGKNRVLIQDVIDLLGYGYGRGAMMVIREIYDEMAAGGSLNGLMIIEHLKSGWADRIKHVTFTGVDRWTDISKLKALSVLFPKVEFGVLMSQNWNENTPRFYPPEYLVNLEGLGFNLSLHLCGELARQAIRNNFQPAIDMCQGYFGIFKRCQLNIASYDTNPETLELDVPDSLEEVIIQQKGAKDLKLFKTADNPKLSVLLDASGGRGISGNFSVPSDIPNAKIGYAGGLNNENVVGILESIVLRDMTHDIWFDMESSVRTDDRFDVEKVADILMLLRPLI